MKLTKNGALLLVPCAIVFILFLAIPLVNVLEQSFRTFVPGHIGASKDAAFTLFNYKELFIPAYFFYFEETVRLGVISSTVALIISFPMAYFVARTRSPIISRIAIGFFFAMMFVSTMVRVYALQLTFGPTGFSKIICGFLDIGPNSRTYAEMIVTFGLLHYQIPPVVITLLATIKNLNPRLAEAAEALGAARWKVHSSITVPLCMPGIVSAFLISFTLCLSAFVVPMVLGKGKVLFASNLIYSRFSEIANYPSGSAIAITMLLLSLLIVYGVNVFASRFFNKGY